MKTNKKTLITVILLLIILCGTFAYSVKVRSPWFGKLSVGHHQWLTGSTLVFTKNWFRDGAFKSYFAMYENPKSIESPAKRGIYASYPPGAIIPIYAISKIINKEPTPAMVMSYNLANQFFITLLLIATVFIFLRRLGLPLFYTFLFSLIPLATELFLPAPMYWHQNVFFSDQAVILPFIFFIFLEILRDGLKKHKSAEQ
ncbi:hypothetical protein KKG71_07185, partial [Patescibacteria group bacterium]|nr:hypothetical protein [Patescibacteria group bacterium]